VASSVQGAVQIVARRVEVKVGPEQLLHLLAVESMLRR
jgi:hypothetical protein